jgi:hypothetical protein
VKFEIKLQKMYSTGDEVQREEHVGHRR